MDPYTAAIPAGAGFWRQSCAERGGGCWDSPKAWRDWTPCDELATVAFAGDGIRHIGVAVWSAELCLDSGQIVRYEARAPLCSDLARTSRTKMFDEAVPELHAGQSLCPDCAALMEV